MYIQYIYTGMYPSIKKCKTHQCGSRAPSYSIYVNNMLNNVRNCLCSSIRCDTSRHIVWKRQIIINIRSPVSSLIVPSCYICRTTTMGSNAHNTHSNCAGEYSEIPTSNRMILIMTIRIVCTAYSNRNVCIYSIFFPPWFELLDDYWGSQTQVGCHLWDHQEDNVLAILAPPNYLLTNCIAAIINVNQKCILCTSWGSKIQFNLIYRAHYRKYFLLGLLYLIGTDCDSNKCLYDEHVGLGFVHTCPDTNNSHKQNKITIVKTINYNNKAIANSTNPHEWDHCALVTTM